MTRKWDAAVKVVYLKGLQLAGKCCDYGCTFLSLVLVDTVTQDFFWNVWSSWWMSLAESLSLLCDWNNLNNTMALFLREYFSPSHFPSASLHVCSRHTHIHTHITCELVMMEIIQVRKKQQKRSGTYTRRQVILLILIQQLRQVYIISI